MTRTHLKTIAVVTGHDQPKLSKGQQAFNKLIKQIEKKRVQLAGKPPYHSTSKNTPVSCCRWL